MDDHKTVTAIFVPIEYQLTITASGNGTVTKNPDQATYHYGEIVELTAVANSGWTFDHWDGALSGNTNPQYVTINGDMMVSATFTQIPYTLVVNVDYEKLSGDRMGESTECIRKRVQTARDIQLKRFTNHQSAISQSTDVVCNADMRVGEIRQFCRVGEEGQRLMRAAMTQLNLSARAYHRILKLARTIADLAGCEEIQSAHLAEALQYRPKLMVL